MIDFMGIISRSVYLPILYKRRGLDVSAWEQRALCIESMETQALKQYQMRQLNDLLGYAHQNVAYYRNNLNDVGIDVRNAIDIETFKKLPILTKSMLRDHFEDLTSATERNGKYKNMTGGSTGTPVVFLQDAEYQSAALGIERCILAWWGIRPGDRSVAFWGSDRELHEMSVYERLMMWSQREKIFDSFAMTEEKMACFAGELRRWKPKYVKGYASSLHLFARFLLSNPQYCIRPHAIRSTAETLFDWQRSDIEEAFKCKVYNFYGSREVNNIAAECSHQNGLHVLAGTRIVEVVDADGNSMKPGELGRIIVTDLVNRTMPFIRYENGDLGILSEEPCVCGLSYPLLKKVTGRVSDILVGINGCLVHGEFISHLFYGLNRVRQFKLVQRSKEEIDLFVHADTGSDCIEEIKGVCEKIKNKMGKSTKISIEFVDSFERASSGKHQFIISKVSPFKINL